MVKAKLWRVEGDGFISFYSRTRRLHVAIPPELEPLTHRCAQIIYTNQRKAIDLFILKNPLDFYRAYNLLASRVNTETKGDNVRITDVERIIKNHGLHREEKLAEIERKAGVVYRTQKEFKGKQSKIRLQSIADICDHYEGREEKIGKGDIESKLILVDEVLLPTQFRRKGHIDIKRGTKSELHPDFCILDLAIDFVSGCPAYAEKVLNSKGEELYLFNPWDGCSYCYARPVNRRNFAAGYFYADEKTVGEQIRKHKQDFVEQGRKIRALRFGQRTENFIPELMDSLLAAVVGAYKEGVISVIPTKTPLFRNEDAKILKECNSTLLISIDKDELSPGICKKGFTNEVRMVDSARKFHEAGVRVIRYVLTDMTKHPLDQKLENVTKAYIMGQKDKIPTYFLLSRANSKKILKEFTDAPLILTRDLKQVRRRKNLFSADINGYIKIGTKNFYYPLDIHPFYKQLIMKRNPNLGVCAVVPPIIQSLCSNCGIPGLRPKKGFQEEVPLKNADKIKKKKRKRYLEKKQREKERRERLQIKLDFEK